MSRLSIGYVLGSSSGGIGRHVGMLADGCARAGLAVAVYGPPGAGVPVPGPAGLAGDSGAVGPAGVVGFAPVEIGVRPRPARDLATALRLRRLLSAGGHDVVHAHGMRAGALAALALAGPGGGPPLLVTVHNAPPAGRGRLVHGALERVVARRADAVACVSADLAERMARLGARDGGRAVVPAPPADPPAAAEVAAARAAFGAGGRPVVLAVGRLAAQKGFGVLLSAAARWRDRRPCPLVVIAGDGPLAPSLRAQSERDGVDVRFLGRRDDVPVLLAAADVVVAPSRWEGQPLIVQEALRAGCAVVASRVGGVPDLTGEDGAMLVPPGDVGALAAAVLAVLGDPARSAALSAAALARAAQLPEPADAVAAALALYRRLAGSLTRPSAAPRAGG